eukprot:6105143-Prorocentrum_lima.AAC.1
MDGLNESVHMLYVLDEGLHQRQHGLGSACGVGGTNSIRHKAPVPICVSEVGSATYSGSMLENGEVPALLG